MYQEKGLFRPYCKMVKEVVDVLYSVRGVWMIRIWLLRLWKMEPVTLLVLAALFWLTPTM